MGQNTAMPGDRYEIELLGFQHRMRRAAREIIATFFLTEEEAKQVVEEQMRNAVSRINWAEIFHKELESQLKTEVARVVSSATQQLMWGAEVRKIMRDRLIQHLRSDENNAG